MGDAFTCRLKRAQAAETARVCICKPAAQDLQRGALVGSQVSRLVLEVCRGTLLESL